MPGAGRPPLFSILLVSATALAYEVLLTRLFSIIQWHHFAYLIISLALLGYGLSGTVLALARRRWLRHYATVYIAQLVLFGLAMPACYLLAQALPFNPEELLWDPTQLLHLSAIYWVLSLPFFFAANAVGLSLMRYRARIPRVYGVDLAGAGLGAILIIALLFALFPMSALAGLAGLGLAAAAVAAWELGWRPARVLGLAGAAVLAPAALIAAGPAPAVSPYKALSQSLRVSGAEMVAERSSPLGLISVVQNHRIPLRYAPGLSLRAQQEPPEQLGVFTDADAMTVITRDTGERRRLAYLDRVSWAAPYHINKPRRVLVLGAGGGSEVLQALYHRVPHIDAVELNPQIIELVQKDYRDFAGGLYARPQVRVHAREARGFVAASGERFDLIQLALLGAAGASATGLYALNESYLYTVEALRAYLDRLAPGGYLAISRWIKLPPRDMPKLVATAIDALARQGHRDPRRRLMLLRSWQTGTLLIKNGLITEDETRALRRFSRDNAFDLIHYPGMRAQEANRFNLLKRPYFFQATRALLSPARESFMEQYKFDLRPATDDRPYFFQFLKWRTLPELLSLRGRGGMALIEWGYAVLIAALLQALAAGALLLWIPLRLLRRRGNDPASPWRAVFFYFFAIGLGFLFLEIAFIQKFILFLHHPVLALAVALSGFLVFAGLGSVRAAAWMHRETPAVRMRRAAVAIAVLGAVYVAGLPFLFDALLTAPLALKVGLALGLIAPLAFFMGMPFPLALSAVGRRSPALVPWAWAVNGCASVLSTMLATLIALHFGFTTVVASAAVLYLVAAAMATRLVLPAIAAGDR